MKLSTLAAAAALAIAGVSVPAFAQDAAPSAAVAVGAKVFGPDGTEVGTIEKVQGANVIVNTGNLKAALPATVFGTGDKGPTIGWNKAQLEAAVTEANQASEAQLQAAFGPQADLYSSDSQLLGKITSVGTDTFVVALASGEFTLPREQVTMQNNKLTFLAKAADVAAAVAAQGGATAAPTPAEAPSEGQGGD
jgi:hypothetical protein